MHPAMKSFIELLERDANDWEDAARRCDSLIPYLVGNDQKQQWKGVAENYRANAQSHRALIKQIQKEEERK